MLGFVVVAVATHLPSLSVLPEHARHGSLADHFDSLEGAGEENWLTVPLNWNWPFGNETLRIRYFVDESHFDSVNKKSPIFVGMGGEGGTSGASCTSYRTDAVRDHRALCVSVEHRFYGKSVPTT
jgi:hypothetical protein